MNDTSKSGVVFTPGPLPPMGPGVIASTLKKVVHEALGELPPGAGGAAVTVTSDVGVNLVVAHRAASGRWDVAAWVGKNFGSDPLTFGATARVLW